MTNEIIFSLVIMGLVNLLAWMTQPVSLRGTLKLYTVCNQYGFVLFRAIHLLVDCGSHDHSGPWVKPVASCLLVLVRNDIMGL